MNARRLLVIVLALTMIPVTGLAQDAGDEARRDTNTVTFYGHVFGNGLDTPMPANTEAPIGEDNYGIGLGGNCASLDATGQLGDCEDTSFNKLALFSSAGFVDPENRAEFLQLGGYTLLHNERGQTKDIVLDTSQNIEASVYFTMDMHGWPVSVLNGEGTNCIYPHPEDVPCVYPYWGWDPGIFNDVVVDVTLYSASLGDHGANASDAPPIEQELSQGDPTIVAQGQWGPDMVTNGLPGSPNVNQFVVDLGPPQTDTIPRDEDFFLVYSIYQETGGENYQIRSGVRWWSGEFFPPTFTMPVKNAFDVERVIPTAAHGKMAILGVMNTPWGSYDIDEESIEIEIEGPRGQVNPESLSRFGDVSFAHGGHYLPINVTWIWDYQKDGLTAGDYEITVSAANFQGSAAAECTASFELRAAQGDALEPVNVQEGACGQQSASEDFLEGIEEGATQQSSS